MRADLSHDHPEPQHVLGELEAAIMQVIWQRGEVTVREVWETLKPQRPLAYTTVMTVMGRLVPKGVLTAHKQGKTHYYRATMTREELVAQRAQRAVRDVITSFGDVALAHFLRELEGVNPERLAALRALADKERSDAT